MDAPVDNGGCKYSRNGNTRWHDTLGRTHRDGDLPAFVFSDGTRYWYRHGEPHRAWDLPAVVRTYCGTQEWWAHGVRQSVADCARNRRWSPLRAAFFCRRGRGSSRCCTMNRRRFFGTLHFLFWWCIWTRLLPAAV